jgi:hypothetical protein
MIVKIYKGNNFYLYVSTGAIYHIREVMWMDLYSQNAYVCQKKQIVYKYCNMQTHC